MCNIIKDKYMTEYKNFSDIQNFCKEEEEKQTADLVVGTFRGDPSTRPESLYQKVHLET